ncbi:hypothetical protein N665_0319s0046 [Sinapis alba]|nr:hypothetical protein N665_0319s0046 [Sinapis alba]
MGDDLDKIHEDRLVINASKYLSSSSFLEKKQPDFFDGFLDYDPLIMSPDNPFSEPTKASPTVSQSSLEDQDVLSPDLKFSPPPPPPPLEKNSSSDQVVVLRVSLHCKGCAGKVKKHLSKLKGLLFACVIEATEKNFEDETSHLLWPRKLVRGPADPPRGPHKAVIVGVTPAPWSPSQRLVFRMLPKYVPIPPSGPSPPSPPRTV